MTRIRTWERAITRENILTDEEVDKVLNEIKTKRERIAVEGPLFTGFRSSELIHMREDWIPRKKIQIPSRMKCDCWACKKVLYKRMRDKVTNRLVIAVINGERVVKKPSGVWMPKTVHGARGIDLNPMSEDLFGWYYKHQERVMESIPCTGSHYYILKKLEKRLRLKHKLFPHGLRGVFASRLAEQNPSPYKFQAIMGWASLAPALEYLALYGSFDKAKGLTEEMFRGNA